MQNKNYFHISLHVKQLDRTVSFYKKLFGQEPDKVKPGYAKFIVEVPALVISFEEAPKHVASGFGHLGFLVPDSKSLEEAKARLSDIISFEEKDVACCYAVQDKFWVTDPDGYQWEVYHFIKDREVNDTYSSSLKKVCCS
jgi:catechol 2,3-dioxygenase-like lactoylglutathione lyase family enzyme